ncbi:50S ribosomal protein L1-like [Anneissia japonica]|uniref:50S ribosomal protein L1-like n=1 Tax=Anneissia japonica TaxID=1529436 RepID=UPI001425B094|nr:50S ribosomal protein L1-like [Anneissia japonica]
MMVLLKGRYLRCVLRNVRNTPPINQQDRQLPMACLYRAFTNIASEESEIKELPRGLEGWEPVDDVYRISRYPIKARPLSECIDELRSQDKWAYCRKPELYSDRTVNLSLLLDLVIEKKKKVDPFQGMVILPHKFKEYNKVLCFAEDDQATEALKSGAHKIGDKSTVDKIMEREFKDFDYVVATPSSMAILMPLKSRLRKRFPNPKRGKTKQSPCCGQTKIAGTGLPGSTDMKRPLGDKKVTLRASPHLERLETLLSLSNSQLEENVKTLIEAICKHKPPTAGPLIRKATINAFLLDGHPFEFQSYVPVPTEDDKFQYELHMMEEQLQKKL